MAVTYNIDTDNGVVLVKGDGTVTDQDMIDCAERLRADPDLRPDMPSLCDMRGIESKTTRTGMERVVGILRRTADRREKARSAMLVDKQVTFGLGRMFATLADGVDPEFKVFDDEDAAHVWLNA